MLDSMQRDLRVRHGELKDRSSRRLGRPIETKGLGLLYKILLRGPRFVCSSAGCLFVVLAAAMAVCLTRVSSKEADGVPRM